MKEGYIIRDQSKAHFITATVVDWIDVFTRKRYCDIVLDCFQFCIKNKGMILYGYVIISNHIHMIIQSEKGKLSDLVRDFKKFTATAVLKSIQNESESRREWMLERFALAKQKHNRNKNYQFWQYGNHAEEVYSHKFMWSKLDYIHYNPVRSGIVDKPQEYRYSSAKEYFDEGVENKIGITKVSNPVVDVLKPSAMVKYIKQ